MIRFILRTHQAKDNCIEAVSGVEVNDHQPMEVVIRPFKNNRTLEQNSKLHAMFGDLAEFSGYTIEDIKEYLMEELGYVRTIEVNGKTLTRRMETSKMSVGELSALIERVYAWAADNGIPL